MQLKEEHIKILKNVLRNDIAIEKEQLKRLEALKNKLNDKDFMEKLLSTNHFEERIRLNYRTIMLTGKTIEQLIEPLTNIKIDYTKVHIDYIPIKHKEIEK